jgi:hypothetical protein
MFSVRCATAAPAKYIWNVQLKHTALLAYAFQQDSGNILTFQLLLARNVIILNHNIQST